MDDLEIAAKAKLHAQALNETLKEAYEQGLHVSLSYEYKWPVRESSKRPLVSATLRIHREIEVVEIRDEQAIKHDETNDDYE